MKPHHHVAKTSVDDAPTTGQRLFTRYLVAILVDLLILSLFAEYWHKVTVSSFSIALMAAVIMQLLLQGTLVIEHNVAARFAKREGVQWQVLRWVSAWLILFISKLVMLWSINLVLGDSIQFMGPNHGVFAFLTVIVAMVSAEELVFFIYRWLGDSKQPQQVPEEERREIEP